MTVGRLKRLFIFAAIILSIGFLLLRRWQGPELQGYTIQSLPLVQTVVATGRVVSVSRAQIGSEITGIVLERRVQEGDLVAAGDILLVLRSDELAAQMRQAEAALAQLATTTRPQAKVALTKANALLAQATREKARRSELSERHLLAGETLEQAEQAEIQARAAADAAALTVASLAAGKAEETLLIERLASTKAQLAKTVVRAEVDGMVLTRNVEPGDQVQPGKVLFEIALTGDTEILVPIDEKNLSLLSLKQSAQGIADAYPADPFIAQINFIAPSIDPQRGTVDIRLKVDPVPAFLRQDMTVSVNIETGRRQQALVVPNDALANIHGNNAQVLTVSAGKVQRTAVTMGLRGLTLTEITAGLLAGDQVVADASKTIADGQRVRLVVQALPMTASSTNESTRNELPVNLH